MEPIVQRWKTSLSSNSRWGVLEGGSEKLDESEISTQLNIKNPVPNKMNGGEDAKSSQPPITVE